MADLLDANILLRFFTGDDPAKADRCERLLRSAVDGGIRLRVTDVCIAEIVWTLGSFYKVSREAIADKIVALVNTRGIDLSAPDILLEAAERFRNSNADYIDAYHAAVAAAGECAVYSYDHDLDRFDDVERKEP